MISLIICSRHSDIPQTLKDNIDSSIGVDYELIIIDNSENKYSIFSAYNEGVSRAKYPLLCFMHEDILYRTMNWGQKIIKHFSDDTIGLIGMLGAHFLPAIPTYWTTSPFYSTSYIQVEENESKLDNKEFFFKRNNLVDAVVCDGMCFFLKKELFGSIKFDENYKGFHFYDMDICMQVLTENSRVVLCNDVLVEHLSLGSYNKNFYINQIYFYEKWKTNLPIHRGIEDVPIHVIEKLNQLYKLYWSANRVRESWAYKIGKLVLKPFGFLKVFLKI